MSSLGDQIRDWHRGVLAVAREDWDSALCFFSDVREPLARMYFNMGCVHLMAGNPEAALRVSAPRLGNRSPSHIPGGSNRENVTASIKPYLPMGTLEKDVLLHLIVNIEGEESPPFILSSTRDCSTNGLS